MSGAELANDEIQPPETNEIQQKANEVPHALLIQSIRPLVNIILKEVNLFDNDDHVITYSDLLAFVPNIILLVESRSGKINLSGAQKKQLVIESVKRIILLTKAKDYIDPTLLDEFLNVSLPILIDSGVWLANNSSKAFKKSLLSCRKHRASKKT